MHDSVSSVQFWEKEGRVIVKGAVPKWLREMVIVLREALVDAWRYQLVSGARPRVRDGVAQDDRHEARLTLEYHRVEKGLSLRSPRRPFGRAVKPRLVELLCETRSDGASPPYVELASDALGALDHWNDGGSVDDAVSPRWEVVDSLPSADELASFFASRHSVRDFDTTRLPTRDELVKAVEMARNTPSVCNRQGYRVHIYTDRARIDEILAIQNAAGGFSDTVPAVAVVTARRAMFIGPMERNQRWVDGGLFAMTLVWAFQAVGLGTCMLNWSMGLRTSDRLRAVADISDGEDIVVLLAIGHAAEGARVARSAKRSVDDLAIFHGAEG